MGQPIDFVGKLALIVAAATLTGGVAGCDCNRTRRRWPHDGLCHRFRLHRWEPPRPTVGVREGRRQLHRRLVLEHRDTRLLSGRSPREIIRLPRRSRQTHDARVKLGRAGGAMIALHGVAELQTLVTKQRLMTWDEHGEAMFTNVVLGLTLHAGKFITDPIEARITKGVLAKLRLNRRIADRIDHVAAKRERLGLKDRLDELEERRDATRRSQQARKRYRRGLVRRAQDHR